MAAFGQGLKIHIPKGRLAMRRTNLVCSAALALFCVMVASAQFPPKSIVVTHDLKPKLGADVEAALKRHIDWHRQQNDTWTYVTWQIVSGERSGHYAVATFGHDWKDFDDRAKFQEADEANVRQTLAPTVESVDHSYYLYRADLSLPVQDQTGPTPYAEVITFFLKPDGWPPDMENTIKKVNEAAKKSNYPLHGEWYGLLNGGEDSMVLVIPHKNWADFQPPDKEFMAMLNEVYGDQITRGLFHQFGTNVRASRSEIFRHRPDLSYVPQASQ
jgi:hypothetical protein